MSDITEQGPAYSLTDVTVSVVVSGAIVNVDLFYARTVAPDPQVQTLTFEGDDTSQEIDELQYLRYTITCDKQDLDALQQVFGKTGVTNSPGEDWALWMADDAEIAGVAAGLRYDVKMKDESASPNEAMTLRYTVPLGVLKLVRPQQAEWKAKHQFVLNFTATKTTKDLLGGSLSGVPGGGAYYRVARVT